MKKVILVDGNNLLFRSYYATAYSGSNMRNSKGFPTNGLFGFINMMNKIISEEKPEYIMVAFDKGKTFRHERYADYKGGRAETPDELKMQFPVAKKILDAMGVKHYEIDNYEADDIIGSFAKMIDNNPDYIGTIVSSDKDLLQLITDKVDVKLLKSKDYIRMNRDVFYENYGIEPIRMIDLKGLEGDASDNIKGVKGIGEKTALKLLKEYDTIENLYANIDKIKGSIHEKLVADKESAFASKELATIYKDVPLGLTLEDIAIQKENTDELIIIYNDLEFYSFLKKQQNKVETKKPENNVKIVKDIKEINITSPCAFYIELDNSNYHLANIIGASVYNEENSLFIPYDVLKNNPTFLLNTEKYTYDYKKVYVSLTKHEIAFSNFTFDLMLSAYLLNYNVKEDITYLANSLGSEIPLNNNYTNISTLATNSIEKARFIYENKDSFVNKMKTENITNLYEDIEFPLSEVLAKMELEGVRIDRNVLLEMKEDIKIKLELISQDIYNNAGCEFNISSSKQLGTILFEKLGLPFAKKNKIGYVTDSTVLNKLVGKHPIIDRILEYRTLSKLYYTYVESLLSIISNDDKIHTIYTQTQTRTGRLSSIEPNLQNIPVRNEIGKQIRKAFIPENNSVMMSSDYSQIELRVFAHMSNVSELIDAFKKGYDIHTKTAADVNHVPIELVTKEMRRKAKAVNFGIIYGISSFGLSEDLRISPTEAKMFIEDYFNTYPGVKDYMNKVIAEAHEKGYVKTITNRKRIIEELNNKNYMIRSMGERMALNTPIQGTAADILKIAMIKIDKEIETRKLKSKMLLQVHDELIFNIPKEEKEIMEKLVTDIMDSAYKLNVPLVVDVSFGNNWYEAKWVNMNKTNKVLLKSLITNTFLVASKITFGFLGNFKSLIADGIHSLSDLMTDIIAIFGNHMALKPADSKHPFGHGKIEYLTSIIIGLVISALSLILITSAFINNSTKPSNIVIYVSFITVILKYILASYILKKGYQYKNNILIASGKESKTDVLSTFVVIIAFFLTKLTKYNHLFNYADPLATIIVALFILYTGISILKENIISIIGEKETNQEYINLIKEIIQSDERIKKIDELEIMKYGSYYQVNIDISIKDNLTIKEGNNITNNLKQRLISSNTKISYVKISVNPYGGEENAWVTRSWNC